MQKKIHNARVSISTTLCLYHHEYGENSMITLTAKLSNCSRVFSFAELSLTCIKNKRHATQKNLFFQATINTVSFGKNQSILSCFLLLLAQLGYTLATNGASLSKGCNCK